MNMSKKMPLIEQMDNAQTVPDQISILLRVPDGIIMKYHVQFADACKRLGFNSGIDFVNLRIAALTAVRDENGLLPDAIASDLESARRAFVNFRSKVEHASGS
jgi:hypothetical protein